MRCVPPIAFTDAAFTRVSANATYWGADGLLKTAATGLPRFSYNPADTTAPPYLMLELAAATNLLLYCRDGTQAAWTKLDTTPALTQTGIDGAANTATLYTQGAAGTAQVSQAAAVAAGSTVTATVHLKRGNADWLLLYLTGPALANGVRVWFNTATGSTSGLAVVGAGTLPAVKVVRVSGGFWAVQLTGKPDAAYTSAQLTIMAVVAAGNTARAAAATYIADYAQLEVGTAASSPILTGAATATRAAEATATATPFYISSIPDPDASIPETIWVSGENVAVNLKRTYGHRVYRRKVAGAGAVTPDLDPINWEDAGPTNRQAMFDLNRNRATTAASSFSVAMAPGKRVNTLALTGLRASSVRIDMRVGSKVYYTKTIKTVRRFTTGWLSYLIGAFRFAPSIILMNLPVVTGAVITVTFIGTGLKCAGVVVGTYVDMGTAEMGASADTLNFSKIVRDDFGEVNLVKRRSVPTADIRVKVPRALVNSLRQLKVDVDTMPALWTALDDFTEHDYFESFLLMGIFRKFNFSMDSGFFTTVVLQLEEI